MIEDIPSPIDLRNHQHALDWQNSANVKRPWRRTRNTRALFI